LLRSSILCLRVAGACGGNDALRHNKRMHATADPWDFMLRQSCGAARDAQRYAATYREESNMKRCLRLLICVAVFGILATSSASPEVPRQSEVSAEEYAVYSALISEEYMKEKVKLVVVANPTIGESRPKEEVDYFLDLLPPLTRETLDDYLAINSKTYRLNNAFSLKAKYVIVEFREIERFFENPDFDEAWKDFYKRFPASNGYIALSRVGFNRAKDQALVSKSWMCNQRCGEGKLVLMVKRDGKWKVENQHLMWVS
jgi:hypothetical protein